MIWGDLQYGDKNFRADGKVMGTEGWTFCRLSFLKYFLFFPSKHVLLEQTIILISVLLDLI